VCERIGSVCSGTFLLARAGLLDGRRATTHWAACERFRQMFPAVRLEPDALYVQDGDLWTSAGVTTGIDMALAMVGGDHGALLAAKVARQLVVYSHRPGHQSQFSSLLDAQTRATVEFAGLIDWVQARLEQPIRIAEMAAEMGMSERSFLRKFKEATGEPPSKYLDRLRIEKARVLLAAGASIKQTTLQVGFQSEAAFRSAFTARIGVSPSHYAKMQGARTV
jgi:transcriptional regulator GlxA family with amidase domain